jgi:hypothetical protein
MPAQKTIVIWIRSSQKETFSSTYHKGASYLALLQALRGRGHRVFLAFDAAAYDRDTLFYPAAEYRDGALRVPESAEPVRADAVFNLGNIPGEDLPGLRIANTPSFRKFFSSKFAAYELLREFFPETIRVAREEDLLPALARLPGVRAVFKPDTGTNGRGVRILKKAEAALDGEMRAAIKEPGGALVQAFVDTSAGIPGVCDSYHDLRVAVMNGGAIALTHVRTPEPGGLIANYARGATIRELSPADLPQNILALHRAVYKKIAARFPDPMYTMDAGIGAGGEPLLFEINGTVAFPWPEFKGSDFFIENLVRHLENLAE